MSEKNVTQPLVQGTDQNPQAQIEILFNNLGLATGFVGCHVNVHLLKIMDIISL